MRETVVYVVTGEKIRKKTDTEREKENKKKRDKRSIERSEVR